LTQKGKDEESVKGCSAGRVAQIEKAVFIEKCDAGKDNNIKKRRPGQSLI